MVALALIARIEGITWIEKGWRTRDLPSPFMQYEKRELDDNLLEQWVIVLVKAVVSRNEMGGLAIDSSGLITIPANHVYGVSSTGLK